MNLQTEKLKIIELLLKSQNVNLISKIKELFEVEQQVLEENLTTEQIDLINIAMIQMQNNQTVSFDQHISKYR